VAACNGPSPSARPAKVYVCAQTAANVEVLDGESLDRIATIQVGAGRMPHNVQVAPGGAEALVTSADAEGVAPDEVLIIDTATDTIWARVALDAGALIAHVVVSPDGQTAYVTGWASNRIYRIDLPSRTRGEDIILAGTRNPHGLRLSADGARLYTANSAGSVSEIDAASGGTLREFALPGPAVQVAVAPAAVYTTVFDPPSVARIDLASGAVDVWPLNGGKGPAQLALSPDGATVYVADQGLDATPGERLFALDATTGAERASWEVGRGAHGVALTADGAFAYVTSVFDSGVEVVDLAGGTVRLGRTGRGPNGIGLLEP
jgi:DNA-binding beta-propeller fold protein YncE